MREILDEIKAYFNAITTPTEEERGLLEKLDSGYFPVVFISRNDLETLGFDTINISDDQMVELAKTMEKVYMDDLFWDSMKDIAEDEMHLPVIDNSIDCNTIEA